MVGCGLTARKVLSAAAIENDIVVDLAIGGSTYSTLHLPAIAHELGIELPLERFNELNRKVPTLLAMSPNGPNGMVDLYRAGGIPAVMKALVDATEDDFCAFTGMCLNLTQTMAVGASGAICPLPNVLPQKAVLLYEALRDGNEEMAAPLQADFYALGPLLAASPTPHALVKEAMRLLGHDISAAVKSPLPQLSPQQADQVRNTLVGAGLLEDLG